jgi:tetratricopeptide (TPR) repeat protein
MRMNLREWSGSVAIALLLWAVPMYARPQQAPSAQAESLYQQGERALAEQRYAEAAQAYEQLQQLQPGVAEVHARLGLIYFQQGRYADAIPPLRRALKLKPALPNLDALLAMCLSETGQHKEALPALEKGFHHQSADAALRRMIGLHLERSYTDMGRDADAVAVALELSRLYPDDPEVLYHTGRLFGNYAYLQVMRLSRVAPDSVWLHQAVGEANESQGLLDDAIKEYRLVLAASPNRPGVHFRIGRVLLARSAQGKGDAGAEAAALEEFDRELQIDPSNANAAYEIGEIQRKAGRLDMAVASFKKAVEADPEFEEALVGLGRTLIASADPGAALAPLKKATALDPRDEVAFYQIAQAHRALGEEAAQREALATFERLRSEKATQATVPAGRPNVTKQSIDTIRD